MTGWRLALVVVAVLYLAFVIKAINDFEPDDLKPGDVRPALRALPYELKLTRIKGPPGNTASFVGKAHGPHDTTLEFSIGIGDPPRPIPVPGAGTKHVTWHVPSNYVLNDDSEIALKFNTAAQWQEVARMSAEVACLLFRATGEPCGI